MALCKRLIARLDIKGSRLIKGVRFEGLRVVGDPWEAAVTYSQAGADELLYIDAVASLYGRNGLQELLRRTSQQIFVPITAGGGVRSVADAANLLAAGADKIAVNTAALQRPEFIAELASEFGSQCVVASIQARRIGNGKWEAMAEAGRERSGRDVMGWIKQLQQLGAGELLVTSVDQDGTCKGPDLELLEHVCTEAKVPLVFGGGFSTADEVHRVLLEPKVFAVCIGSALHQKRMNIDDLKINLVSLSEELQIRLPPQSVSNSNTTAPPPLEGHQIGIIDYGMGNQQSLINALQFLGANVILSALPDELQTCGLLALPGVGSFPKGMAELKQRKLDIMLDEWIKKGMPLIGICLGMQMLFKQSEEFLITSGLGYIEGKVVRLEPLNDRSNPLVLPHLGWNRLQPGNAALTDSDAFQYFVHSYVATNVNPSFVMYNCIYEEVEFIAGVQMNNIVGLQFHPERSGSDGLELLSTTCSKLLNP